jgi:ABC-type lipoprotein export system ATPase subunit
MPDPGPPIIRVRGLVNRFGDQVVHDGVDLDVRPGEILGVVGGSGSGKSVLMRSIIGLRRPDAGEIEVLGVDGRSEDADDRYHIERNTGVLFQDGALFSSLTVGENVQVPLKEHYRSLPDSLRYELALLKVKLAGLPADALNKLPSQLSGGMRKRAGLARALALPAAFPRRTHRGPGSDWRGRLRQAHADPATGAGPDGVPHHPRSGHAVRYLRPRCGARRPQGDRRCTRGRTRATRPPLGAGVFQRTSGPGGSRSRAAGIGCEESMRGIPALRISTDPCYHCTGRTEAMTREFRFPIPDSRFPAP